MTTGETVLIDEDSSRHILPKSWPPLGHMILDSSSVACSADGNHVAWEAEIDPTHANAASPHRPAERIARIVIASRKTGAIEKVLHLQGQPEGSLWLSFSAKYLALGGGEGSDPVSVWNIRTGQTIHLAALSNDRDLEVESQWPSPSPKTNGTWR